MRNRYKINVIILLSFTTLLIAISIYLFFYEPFYKGNIKAGDNVLIISHRGFGNYAPDNSLSGVKMAINEGLDGVELDAQLTSDGEVIIFHDSYLERLTNGTGPVSERTLKELKTLEYGLKFSLNYSDERIPSFDELLRVVNGSVLVILEIKCGTINCGDIEKKTINLIKKYNAQSYVYVDSFNPFVLYRIKRIDPRIITVFDFRDIEPYDPSNTLHVPFFLKNEPFRRAIRKIIKPDLLSSEITVKQSTINKLNSKGYPLILWTPNTDEEINRSLSQKPFAILTDEPIRALSIRGNINEGN